MKYNMGKFIRNLIKCFIYGTTIVKRQNNISKYKLNERVKRFIMFIILTLVRG